MSDRDHSALAQLALSPALRAKALQLLADIDRADNLQAILIATARGVGFCEALEVLHALNPQDLENLYVALDGAGLRRQQQLQSAH